MLLISHPTGNANVRGVITALERADKLASFQTTVAVPKSSWYFHFLPTTVKKELLRRAYDLPSSKITKYVYRELIRLVAARFGVYSLITHETGWASIDSVYRDFDRHVAKSLTTKFNKSGISAVYCYEDAALCTFQAAKQLGLKCFYDLPIGYWRVGQMIQQEEAELNSEWAPTLQANFDSTEKLARKDAELQLSDVIFVASTFTHQTLKLAPSLNKPIVCIPYGAPQMSNSTTLEKPTGRKLQVLFVGSLGQRKGLSYLLDAVNQLNNQVELTLIGKPIGSCRPLEQALNTYRWIASLPHYQILEEMSYHDVLVFPSLFEGFGLVILEAMSRGLPVITTPNTAGPDVITDGEDGFIVPIRSSKAIAEKLDLLDSDRKLLWEMSQAAQHKAAQFSWESYGHNILNTIKTYIK